MAGTGAKGKPVYGSGDGPSMAAMFQAGADYAALVGNRKVGTAAERTALTGTALWEELVFAETDTDKEYVYRNAGWKRYPVVDSSEAVGAFTVAAGWSIASQSAVKIGGFLARVYINFTRTGGTITVPSDGDITNQTVATFRTGWVPYPGDPSPLASSTGGQLAAVNLDSAIAALRLNAVAPGGNIVNTTVFTAGGLYLLDPNQ